MPNFIDVSGQKFNRLTAIEFSHIRNYKTYFKFRCDCGNEKTYRIDLVKCVHTMSCGCYIKELLKTQKNNLKHGQINSRIYSIWLGMKQRCNKPKNKFYPRYGGRGVTLYKEWEEDFGKFYDWSMNNGYAEDLTIERINNDGNYEPSNCKWADRFEQGRNKSNNWVIEIDGVSKIAAQWARDNGIHADTIRRRYLRGIRGRDLVVKK